MFNGNLPGDVGAAYMSWLLDKLRTVKPDIVAIEAPIRSTRAKGSTAGRMLLLGLDFTTLSICRMRGVPCYSVPAPTWRVSFLGRGFPPDPKAEAQRMCSTLGWPFDSDDAADACGVWCWGHLNFGDHREMQAQLSSARVREMEA